MFLKALALVAGVIFSHFFGKSKKIDKNHFANWNTSDIICTRSNESMKGMGVRS